MKLNTIYEEFSLAFILAFLPKHRFLAPRSTLSSSDPSCSRVFSGSPSTLGRCIEVPGLCIAQEVILVVGEAAEEEGATNQDDRGCPSKAIGPVVDVINSGIIMKPEGLCVLHGIDNQGDDLEYSSQCEEASNNSQENEHLGSTQGEEGKDEADDQDDESTEERGSSCSAPGCRTEAKTLVRQTSQV